MISETIQYLRKRILRILLRDLTGGIVQKHMVPDFWMTGLSGERFQ